MDLPKLVIVGTGLEDLKAASPPYHLFVETLLIDRSDHEHLHPMVYQVSQTPIDEALFSPSIHQFLDMQQDAFILMGHVVAIDKKRKQITLSEGHTITYKYLVTVSGTGEPSLSNDHVKHFTPGVQALVEALKIHHRFLKSLQSNAFSRSFKRQKNLGFVPLSQAPSFIDKISPLKPRQTENSATDHRSHLLFEVQL